MQQRALGRTGRSVSAIGLGTWQLGADWGAVAEEDATAVLAASVANAYPLLAVVPNVVKMNWAREVERWTPQRRATVIHGDGEGIDAFADVFIVNYEILDRHLVVGVGGARDPGHLCLERLGDLHRVAADTARGPDDEDALTGCRATDLLDAFERGDAGDR